MTRRRVMQVAVAVVLAFGMRSAHALPTQLVAAAKAATCCATKCHHSHSATTATRCCATPQDATDQARHSSAAPLPPIAVAPTAWTVATVVPPAPQPILDATPRSLERAGPVYLATRSIRR